MSERRRARITAVIALALHAGALLLVRASHIAPRSSDATPPIDEIEIAVVVPSGPEVETPLVEPEEKPVAARSTGGWRSAEPAPAASSSEPGEVQERQDKDQGSAPVALLMTPSPANIGIANGGGTNPFLMNPLPAVAPSAAPAGTGMREQSADEAKKRVEASMRASTRERDVSLGLGADGPVLRALRDSTYSSIAPNRGKAIFLAVVDASGSIVDVRLVSTNGDDRAWGDALERSKKALQGQKLALRGAKGAEVRIEVSSDVLLPSGNRPDGPPVQPKLEPSKIQMHEAAPSGPTAGVVQSWTIAGFDLTDIGAKPRRIVHARVVEARFF